ncbi:MAG: hypothetical protein ABIW84_03055 [Ilumatobacteraceae bacterium]
MRVAFVGKGGAGKSVIAGTFCRVLARSTGHPVVAIDSDSMPGLAYSLGMASTDTMLPPEIVTEIVTEIAGQPGNEPGREIVLRDGLTALDAVEQYAAKGPDGVRLLQFGKLRGHVRVAGPSQQAFRVIVDGLCSTDCHLVGDLPGGTRQPFFGWAGFADIVLVVAEATPSSMLAARRLARLTRPGGPAEHSTVVAIVNKVQKPTDADRLAQFTGLRVRCIVPADPAVGAAERDGVALIDAAPDSPAVKAISSLVESLVTEVP